MAPRSFWEKLGRGVGAGIQKAKEIGGHLSEHAELQEASGQLSRSLEDLGRLVMARSERGDVTIALDDEEVVSLLEEVRRARDRLQAVEARIEEAERTGDAPAAPDESARAAGEREPQDPENNT